MRGTRESETIQEFTQNESLPWHNVDGVGWIRQIHVLAVGLVLNSPWHWATWGTGARRRLRVGVRVIIIIRLLPGLVEASPESIDLLLGDHLAVTRDPPVLVLLGLKSKREVSQAGCIDRYGRL